MIPFAQIAVRDLGDSLREYQADKSPRVILVVGIIAGGGLLVLLLWRMVQRRRRLSRPLALFVDLADFHHVSRKDQKRLLQFARAHRVMDPAHLFVCPGLVERIKSAETAEAAGGKEKDRLVRFFDDFIRLAFGEARQAG